MTTTLTTPNIDLVTYDLLSGDVHQFVWNDVSRQAVDTWFEQFVPLYMAYPIDETMRLLLINERNQMPPLAYVAGCAANIGCNYPSRPMVRVALLQRSQTLVRLSSIFTPLLSWRTSLQVFLHDDYEQALDWLRA